MSYTGKTFFVNYFMGKVLDTILKAVYHIEGNYFKIEDTISQSKIIYTGFNWNVIPNYETANGKQIGIFKGEYN